MINYNHADYFGVEGIDCVNTVTYDENGVHIVKKTAWHVVGFAMVKIESTYPDGHVETTTSYLKHGTGDYAQPMTEEEAGQFIYDNISYFEENSVVLNTTYVMKVPAYRFDSTLDEMRRNMDSRVVFSMKILKTRNLKSIDLDYHLDCGIVYGFNDKFKEKYGPFEVVGTIELEGLRVDDKMTDSELLEFLSQDKSLDLQKLGNGKIRLKLT